MSSLFRSSGTGVFRLSWVCGPGCEKHPGGFRTHCVSLRTRDGKTAKSLQREKDEALARDKARLMLQMQPVAVQEKYVLRQAKRKTQSCVYFFQSETGLVKIGFTTDIKKRTQGLLHGSPVPLTLLGTVAGNAKLEAELHAEFSTLRRHGEWFELNESLRQRIEAILGLKCFE